MLAGIGPYVEGTPWFQKNKRPSPSTPKNRDSEGSFWGQIGAAGAEMALVGLQYFVFEMEIAFHLSLWLIGPIAGWGIVTIIGVFASRAVLKVPPIRLLKSI